MLAFLTLAVCGTLAFGQQMLTLEQIAAAAEGDHQLRQAYAAAFSASYPTWLTTFGMEPAFTFPTTCPASAAAFPFPANPVGTLANILNTGTVRLAYNNQLVQTSQTGLVIQDGSQNPPVGMAPTFFNAVLQALGNAYGRQYLTVEWYPYCSATDSTGCFDALEAGAVDIVPLTYHLGSTYRSLARFYPLEPSTCITYSNPTPIFFLSSRASALFGANPPTVQSLLQLIAAGSKFNIVAQTIPSMNAAAGFLNTPVLVNSNATAVYAGLQGSSPTYDFVWLVGPPSSYIPLVQALTGNSVAEHLVSLFRRPVLLGATNSTLNPSKGSFNYPPVGNATSAGQQEWILAFDAAVAVTQSNGAWLSSFGSLSGISRMETCLTGLSAYPFPVPTPGGKLANILASKEIRAGFSGGSYLDDNAGVTIINSLGPTVSGVAVTYMNAVAAALSAHYNVTLSVVWDSSFTSTSLGLPKLLNNTLDVFPIVTIYGGNDGTGVNRALNWEFSSCPTFTHDLQVWVLAGSPFSNVTQLLAAVAAGTATLAGESSVQQAELASLGVTVKNDVYAISGVINSKYTAGIGGVNASVAPLLKNLGHLATSVRGSLFAPVSFLNTQNVPAPSPAVVVVPTTTVYNGAVTALGVICGLLVIALVATIVVLRSRAPMQQAYVKQMEMVVPNPLGKSLA